MAEPVFAVLTNPAYHKSWFADKNRAAESGQIQRIGSIETASERLQ